MSSLFSRGFKNPPKNGKFFSKKKALPMDNYDEPTIEELKKSVEVTVEDIVLDPQQRECVYSNEKNIIVVAGAGSGKTRVLTERIRHLIKDLKVPPSNIVSITFTNMAAEEMRMRLSDLDEIGDAFIGTIHSFANRIMKESGEKYTLLSDELNISLHVELINKYCSHLTEERYMDYLDLLNLINQGKSPESSAQGFFTPSEQNELDKLEMSFDFVEDDVKKGTGISFGESIHTLCKQRHIITFDELLRKAKAYFEKIKATIEYVFVDELQDVGNLEYNFIRALNAENYFFVGDDYQAIYGFKGGNVHIFKSLVNDSTFKTYMLTNNYRNGTDILELANIVISQVDDRIKKDITPIQKEKGKVTIKPRAAIDSVLWDLTFDTEDFREYFLLVRTNKELFEMTEKCASLGLPYITFKREGISLAELKRKMKKNAIKILTVHTSKGLEVDNVILYGTFPITVPFYRINKEERRVMYVGITRARKSITVLN